MTEILTHRGLEPDKNNFFPESTLEAFEDQIKRGFGIEFDPNFVKDGIVIFHDSNLKRVDGRDISFSELSLEDVKNLNYGGKIPKLSEVLELIEKSSVNIHAMHLKGTNQTREKVDKLIEEILKFPGIENKIVIFDVKPEFARYIKEKIPDINIAPSVAHEYDIERYNECVSGTLISVEEALEKKDLFDWVWLDEWDLIDKNGKKKLYTKEIFDKLKSVGYKIGLVTPELHGTSPGLYGGEAHEDSQNKEKLFYRIKEILDLNPDLVCTDYPEKVREICE